MTIHKCDLEHLCDIVRINIELISIRNDGHTRGEHYGQDYEEKYCLGLVYKHFAPLFHHLHHKLYTVRSL